MKADVVVVGGGPAGMIAAGIAARNHAAVILLEKNGRLGRKLMITGKGRCNLTNNCDSDVFFNNIPRNPKFLQSAYHGFTSQDTMALLESLGVPLKTERGNRVFPVSDKAADIVDALAEYVKRSGVSVLCNSEVSSLIAENGRILGVTLTGGTRIDASAVIVATGGKSYSLTGSTGDGYRFAEQTGHPVISPRPSLVPIELMEDWCAHLQGLSLKNVALTAVDSDSGKTLYHEQGEMLFTHFGVSGPLVLSASAHLPEPTGHHYKVMIDLKPALDLKTLDARILRDFSESVNKDFANSLDRLFPKKLIPVIVRLSKIPADAKVNQITKEQRKALCELIKAVPLTVWRFRPIDEAVITSGGVSVRAISPKTMESKQVAGLYFVGELIDVDGYTGGFNLQIAFSTGYAAGYYASAAK